MFARYRQGARRARIVRVQPVVGIGRLPCRASPPIQRGYLMQEAEVVNLREAAGLTGWSVKTIRRRCVAGTLTGAQRVQIGQGAAEWVIPVESLWLLEGRQNRDKDTEGRVSVQTRQVGKRTAQEGEGVAALAAVIADLTARLADAQGEVIRLTAESTEARVRVLQLEAGGSSGLLGSLRKALRG